MALPKDQLLNEIDEALRLCSVELDRLPGDLALKKEHSALNAIRAMILDRWPLTPQERSRVNIGIYAIRELEGINEELVAKLATLEQHLTLG